MKIRAFTVLLLVLMIAVYYLVHRLNEPADFFTPPVRIALCVACDSPDLSRCQQEGTRHLLCQGPECLPTALSLFFEKEFKRITGNLTQIEVATSSRVDEVPLPLREPTSFLETIFFHQKLRKEFERLEVPYLSSDIRVLINLVVKDESDRSENSRGSYEGHLGLVEWNMAEPNLLWNFMRVFHEVGHTLGASDHYLAPGKSAFPDGVVDPKKGEKATQEFVELMSGTRPVEGREIGLPPDTLDQIRIGPASAREMRWTF